VVRVFALVMACWIILFVYKVVGVCKNRDTIAGRPVPPLLICRCDYKVFAAQKAVAYTDLLWRRYLISIVSPKNFGFL
jgi:hypothetical protein